jgi:uncharacterized membrane protein YphA (DoxX/SURF4 family)
MSSNDRILTLGLLGLGVYFSVLLVRGMAGYFRFRRVRATALLTWPGRPPAHFPFLVGLGVVSAGLAVLNGLLERPFHHVYSQAVMALYFILMVPLSTRIHLGLYRDGIWADSGFLRYGDIERMAFFDTPEIVLVLLPRGGSGSFRLPVPPAEYGAVRKVLEEKKRAHIMNLTNGVLGLGD